MKRPPSQLLGLAVLLTAALTAGGLPRAAAAPPGPAVEVRTLSESGVKGTLLALDATHVTLREAGASSDRRLPLAEVIDVRLTGVKALPGGGHAQEGDVRLRARLVGGDELVGFYRGPAEEGIVLDVDGLGNVTLLFEVLLSLDSLPPYSGDLSRTYPRPKGGDLAYDQGEDRFGGVVFEATDAALVIEGKNDRKRSIPWQRLKVLHLENDALEQPTGLHAEVELRNGSRLAVDGALAVTPKGLRMKLRSGPGKARTGPFHTVPFHAVRAVRWTGGAFVYATALPFEAQYKDYYQDPEELQLSGSHDAFFGAHIDRRVDDNGHGGRRRGPLELEGHVFRHGFGVNSFSRIEIDLDAQFGSFRARFGIDDVALRLAVTGGGRGNVDARVLADGKELWKATDVRGGQRPLDVGPLDVSGVQKLVLEVGFGKELMTRDRADWVEPILVRK